MLQKRPLPFLLPPAFAFHLSSQLPFFGAAGTKSLGEVVAQPGWGREGGRAQPVPPNKLLHELEGEEKETQPL